MKKTWLRIAYVGVLGVTFLMNSCQDDPIVPNTNDEPTPCWDTDSTFTDPGNGQDTSVWNDPNGNDSTNVTDPVGGGDPADSTGGNFPGDTIV